MIHRYLTTGDFYAGLSPADAEACVRDVILYGEAFTRTGADGVRRHVPREYPGEAPPPADADLCTDLAFRCQRWPGSASGYPWQCTYQRGHGGACSPPPKGHVIGPPDKL